MPDNIHSKLKSRAALAGMSLSEYLLREIRHVVDRPTNEEMRAILASRSQVVTSETSVEVIRAERDRV